MLVTRWVDGGVCRVCVFSADGVVNAEVTDVVVLFLLQVRLGYSNWQRTDRERPTGQARERTCGRTCCFILPSHRSSVLLTFQLRQLRHRSPCSTCLQL